MAQNKFMGKISKSLNQNNGTFLKGKIQMQTKQYDSFKILNIIKNK